MSHLCFQVCSCLTSMSSAAVLTVIGRALIPLRGCSQGLVPGVPRSPRICREAAAWPLSTSVRGIQEFDESRPTEFLRQPADPGVSAVFGGAFYGQCYSAPLT